MCVVSFLFHLPLTFLRCLWLRNIYCDRTSSESDAQCGVESEDRQSVQSWGNILAVPLVPDAVIETLSSSLLYNKPPPATSCLTCFTQFLILCPTEFTHLILPALFPSRVVCFYIHQLMLFLWYLLTLTFPPRRLQCGHDFQMWPQWTRCICVWGNVCVLCCGSRHGKKGEVQQNSIALLVVNDLYNKCIFFFFFFQATER